LNRGPCPRTPEIFRFTARLRRTPGRAALDPGESRPPSRRSGCVSAEPYPPLGCNQYSRPETSTLQGCLHRILDTAGSALDALADHNRCTTQFLRQQAMEFQAMVKMLTATISAISTAGDSNVVQLCAIEKEVEAATLIEDIREIKARLAGCLEGIRKETQRQRDEAARTADEVMKSMEEARSRSMTELRGPDPVTGLPSRRIAKCSCWTNLRVRLTSRPAAASTGPR